MDFRESSECPFVSYDSDFSGFNFHILFSIVKLFRNQIKWLKNIPKFNLMTFKDRHLNVNYVLINLIFFKDTLL